MAIEHPQTMTVEEYFHLEENDPDTRYEYIDGHVYAMAGGTANHDTIKSNLQRILWSLLRGGPCRVYSSDMKVFISETRYFHPDVIVTCDPGDRGTVQAIQSPRLVVEVLSPSTELTDRTWKLQNYRTHPTIEEYMLVDAKGTLRAKTSRDLRRFEPGRSRRSEVRGKNSLCWPSHWGSCR